MSTGLFASKQHRPLRNLKKLLILSPLHTSSALPVSSPLPHEGFRSTPVVVLKAKYSFKAQAPPEMSVKANDYFKFVDRPGNGWLTVQCIDKNKQGLVPALYVDIVVNDPKQPVSLAWLNAVEDPKYAMDDVKSLRLSCVLVDSHNKCWHRMDIRLQNGAHRFVAKTYHDMYQLHVGLVEEFGHTTKLPPLPRTLCVNGVANKAQMVEMVAHAAQLDHYLHTVLDIECVAHSDTFSAFLLDAASPKVEYDANILVPGDSDINEALLPGAFDVTTASSQQRNLLFLPTAPLPPVPAKISHSPSSSFNYSSTNAKYSSYLNQLPVLPQRVRHTSTSLSSRIPELRSSGTVLSFASIFAGYDTDDSDARSRPSHLRTSSLPLRGDYGLPLSSGLPPKSHHSSSSSADSVMSSGSLCRPEPKTPTLDMGSFAHVSIAEEPDYDFRPLEPKMHREMMETKNREGITPGKKHTNSMGRYEIRPRHPARAGQT